MSKSGFIRMSRMCISPIISFSVNLIIHAIYDEDLSRIYPHVTACAKMPKGYICQGLS